MPSIFFAQEQILILVNAMSILVMLSFSLAVYTQDFPMLGTMMAELNYFYY